jgi:hypothetical protein
MRHRALLPRSCAPTRTVLLYTVVRTRGGPATIGPSTTPSGRASPPRGAPTLAADRAPRPPAGPSAPSPCARAPAKASHRTCGLMARESFGAKARSFLPHTLAYLRSCTLVLARTRGHSPAPLPPSRVSPCACPLVRPTTLAPPRRHPRALAVVYGLAPPVFPPGLAPQRSPAPSTAEPTHQHPIRPTPGHKSARGKPLTIFHPSLTLPGELLAGIWPEPPQAFPQGPHCKPGSNSRVLYANQGHFCKETKVSRDLGENQFLK